MAHALHELQFKVVSRSRVTAQTQEESFDLRTV
jgi:hypothetical protein